MPRRIRKPTPLFGAWQLFLAVFFAGAVLSLIASGALLLLSEESGSPLPKAAEDLSTIDRLYLRAYLRLNYDSLRTPSAKSDGIFEVHQGESASDICMRLKQQAWITDADLTCNYLRYTGGDRSIGSGLFLIRSGQNSQQIADSLTSGESKIRVLTVFAGWRLEEIAQALPDVGVPISAGEWMRAATGRPDQNGALAALYGEIPAWASLEGFLLPAEYRVIPGEKAENVVERMALNFWQSLPPSWIAAVHSRGLSVYQATTMASIIQREAMLDEEMPLIASVLYNRLNIDMPLQVDPSIQYAVGFTDDRGGWWPNPLLDTDKGIDSPYNTFLYAGLPPGPICNPGGAALQAVADPVPSTYLYFRAACDGSGHHNFAETYIQHLANACGG